MKETLALSLDFAEATDSTILTDIRQVFLWRKDRKNLRAAAAFKGTALLNFKRRYGMTGLSSREVEDRIQRGLDNVQVNSSTRTVKEIVKRKCFYILQLNIYGTGRLLVIVGSFKDLSFMLIVLANTVINCPGNQIN